MFKESGLAFRLREKKIRGGTAKDAVSSLPIQCMKLEIPEEEWYGNWRRTDKKQRFLRTSIRNAFVVPAKGTYPHLTIDVDFVKRDYRKGIVELTITRLHYSRSPKARRFVFRHDLKSDRFLCEDKEDVSNIVREGNIWLGKAGLPIILDLHPEYKVEQAAEAVSVLAIAEKELAGEEQKMAAEGQAEATEAPKTKKKKKKKSKKVAVSELLEEEQLEEQIKFIDLPNQLGVSNLWELSPDQVAKLLKYEGAMINYFTDVKWMRILENRDQKLKEFEKELAHWRVLVKMGRSRNDLAQVEAARAKVMMENIPLISEYRVADLLSPDLREETFKSKEDSQLLQVGMALGSRICLYLVLRMKAYTIHARLVAFIRFFVEMSKEQDNLYFRTYSLLLLNKLKTVWVENERESLRELQRLQILDQERAERSMVEQEKVYDETIAQVMETLDQTEFVLKRFFMLSDHAKGKLDEWAFDQPDRELADIEGKTKEQIMVMASEINDEIEAFKLPMEKEFARESVGKLR
ncbi:MAG: hypothetical protein MI784_10035 [Cytophagales bacterium]|nr:hypothetical protein [Cytophagales bacterium]